MPKLNPPGARVTVTRSGRYATLWVTLPVHDYFTNLAKHRGQSFNRCVLELATEGAKRLGAEGKLYPGQNAAAPQPRQKPGPKPQGPGSKPQGGR